MTSRIFLAALSLLASGFGGCSSGDSDRTAEAAVAAKAVTAQPALTGKRSVVIQGVDLTGVGYDLGDTRAPIVVVNFSDFGCPYCGSFARETQPSLDKEFIRTGKVFFKYVPFVMGMFPNGDLAARASECAADQGKFWPMHDALYASQSEWKRSGTPEVIFERYAKKSGIKPEEFAACFADRRTDQRTSAATAGADRLRIRATPTFFVNGQMVEGAIPLDQFRLLLNGELTGR